MMSSYCFIFSKNLFFLNYSDLTEFLSIELILPSVSWLPYNDNDLSKEFYKSFLPIISSKYC